MFGIVLFKHTFEYLLDILFVVEYYSNIALNRWDTHPEFAFIYTNNTNTLCQPNFVLA